MKSIGEAKHVFFSGIGGIGISAIARMMLSEGKSVSGSEPSPSRVTQELEKLGARIFVEQTSENISGDVDCFVYTTAIPEDSPELLEAKKRRILVLSYPEALGEVSKGKFTVAVSGTHGKTTTTAMLAKILIDAGLSPTVIVGSLLNEGGTNYVEGESKYLVVEADEYRRSFLNLSPKILVITNIDADHLDYYKDLTDVQSAFVELAAKVPKDGFVICPLDDPNLEPVLDIAKGTVLDYKTVEPFEVKLQVPGEHNRLDAKAAYLAATALGVPPEKAIKALEGFTGTWRRFEYKGEMTTGALVYDDYAHNPQKVKAAIAGAREKFPNKEITVVFQPHLYSRTKHHLKEFGEVLADADYVMVVPIFAAREKYDPMISSEILAEEIKKKNKKVLALKTFDEISSSLRECTSEKDIVVLMGAGDIYKIAGELDLKK